MKPLKIGIICLLSTAIAQADITQDANHLIDQIDPHLNIGVEIKDLTTHQYLYKRHAQNSFIPASNMKLFSTAAALLALGPDYHFTNKLTTDATNWDKHELKGHLYVHLSGDPSFSSARLAAMINSLKQQSIQSIQGDVVLVSRYQNISPYAPGGMTEDLPFGYGAPIAPLVLDHNRFMLTVNPNDTAGKPAILETSHQTQQHMLINKVITKKDAKNCHIHFTIDATQALVLNGCIGLTEHALVQELAVRTPLLYTQKVLKHLLQEAGIALKGHIILGQAPHQTLLLSQDKSPSIAQLIAKTLKHSDNLYADSLFLHTADKLSGRPLNWEKAQQVIKPFLHVQTGIDLNSAIFSDGSGLSRYDLLTPDQTVQLLTFLYQRFPIAYEYIAALPVSGRDGTLQKRLKKPTQLGLIRAKTGTMKGITSLSGYLFTANAHIVAFAIYMNNTPQTKPAVSGRYRYLADALCAKILQVSKTPHGVSKPLLSFQASSTGQKVQKKAMKWRALEKALRVALKTQAVSILFRADELVLQDRQHDKQQVLNVLTKLAETYPFAIAVTTDKPQRINGQSAVVWAKTTKISQPIQRLWYLKPQASI
ncbi:MAG: D-alanyl-D-alanine carboxypeptidase/D-alanyl-D-alanine-endopeptidase [Legionellaceae bacterium]|nr:D-alanyl-D-alanine carboxypeptidase/D-alanyl-D-alanine-endopeptidase [Legionellaceae bacterium]HCA89385.1 D-alanyl-D-alanine carboxypeptidase/D-alanyl-D-alanine-endopeptidase [Legionellales bacterium]|tara:strand:+ start:492 stop:2273 length:1782 start_codon:yes stop_codon:yes gene_type:complete